MVFFQYAEERRAFGFEIFKEWLQLRHLAFKNSGWGHLPYATSHDSIGLEEYTVAEEDWELDEASFVPFPFYEYRDLEWVPPCVVEQTVSKIHYELETYELFVLYVCMFRRR